MENFRLIQPQKSICHRENRRTENWLPGIARIPFVLALIALIHLNCLKVKAGVAGGGRISFESIAGSQGNHLNKIRAKTEYFCLVILHRPPQQQSAAPSDRHFVAMGMLAVSICTPIHPAEQLSSNLSYFACKRMIIIFFQSPNLFDF